MNIVKYIIIFGVITAPALSAEVSICIENEAYPPLINGTNSFPPNNPGFSIQVAQAAAQQVGISLKFIRRPWARCLQMVSHGKANGLLPSIKTDERNALYRFPSNNTLFLSKADYHIFYAKNDVNGNFYETLAKSKNKASITQPELKYGIAAPFGYIAYEHLANLNLLSSHDYPLQKGLEMVANGKLNGYVVIKKIGEKKAAALNITEQLQVTQAPFLQEHLYVAFNKRFYRNHQQKINEFWQHLPESRIKILGY